MQTSNIETKTIADMQREVRDLPDVSSDNIDLKHSKQMALSGFEHAMNAYRSVIKLGS